MTRPVLEPYSGLRMDRLTSGALKRSREAGFPHLRDDTLKAAQAMVGQAHVDAVGTAYVPVGVPGGRKREWRLVRVEANGHTSVLVAAHNRHQAHAWAQALAAGVAPDNGEQ